MARPKKKPFKRLPNGFGSIKKLSGNRRKPYAVYGPTKIINGIMIPGERIGYAEDWDKGYEMLVLHRANKNQINNGSGIEPFPFTSPAKHLPTFSEVYERYYEEKYDLSLREYSEQSKYSTRAAYKNCSALHNKEFENITYDELQKNLDSHIGSLKHSSLELIVNLYHGMYKYALKHDIVGKDYSSFVEIRIPDDDEHGVPFTEDELKKIWKCDSPTARITIILCYSGWRINEFKDIIIDRENNLFIGGLKTAAGKNRIVPIHPCLIPLLDTFNGKIVKSAQDYRNSLYEFLKSIGIEKHTPHDCRHTFSWLCDECGVDKLSKQIMIGHSLGDDITDRVYGHRDIKRLRKEIEKIKSF